MLENSTAVFQPSALLIIKKSKGVTVTPVHPVDEKKLFLLGNSVKRTVCGLWVQTVIYSRGSQHPFLKIS